MTVLSEILVWSRGIPAWQSDAVARLLAKEAMTADDVDDLFALLKAAHGIPDPKGRTPKQLAADQIPTPVQDSPHVVLLAIKNLRHVNKIAENRRLPIARADFMRS